MIKKMKVEGLVALFVALVVVAGFTSNAMAAPKGKVYVCHAGKNLRINGNALDAHLAHGDLPGRCGEVILSEWLDLRCDTVAAQGIFSVTNISASESVSEDLLTNLGSAQNCAEAQKYIHDAMCRLTRDYGTPDAQTYVFQCPEAVVAVPE